MEYDIPHFFGDARGLANCEIVLGYGSRGGIKTIIRKVNRDWVAEHLPEEKTGDVTCLPSVRILFETEAERRKFVALLKAASKSSLCANNDPTRCTTHLQEVAKKALRNLKKVTVAALDVSVEGDSDSCAPV